MSIPETGQKLSKDVLDFIEDLVTQQMVCIRDASEDSGLIEEDFSRMSRIVSANTKTCVIAIIAAMVDEKVVRMLRRESRKMEKASRELKLRKDLN